MATQPFDQRDGFIWYDGELVEWSEVKLHVLSPALHYASAVFEGERVYGGSIFKLNEHTKRLFHSADRLDMEIPYSVEDVDRACEETIAANNIVDGYVRPIAWRGAEMMCVSAEGTSIHLAIATWEWPSYFDPAQRLKGIRLNISRWRRPDPASSPCDTKAAGLYVSCTLSKQEAVRAGYADSLVFDYRGQVAEATGANIFLIRDGVIHTPTPDCFLDGITRRTVIDLARARGYEVVERAIMPDELDDFTECFLTGTAVEVTPVSEIGPHRYTPGEITENLMDDYSAAVQPKGSATVAAE